VISTYIGSGYPNVFWGSSFWCVCVFARAVIFMLSPLYNPVGVVLFNFCVGSLYSLWSFTGFFCYVDIFS
jgi:hypothetical protein